MIETIKQMMRVAEAIAPGIRPANSVPEESRGNADAVDRVRAVLKMAQRQFRCSPPSATARTPVSVTSIEEVRREPVRTWRSYSLLRRNSTTLLDTLTERERKVLQLRFGLGDGYCRTLEEVGRHVPRHARADAARLKQGAAEDAPPHRLRQVEGFLASAGASKRIFGLSPLCLVGPRLVLAEVRAGNSGRNGDLDYIAAVIEAGAVIRMCASLVQPLKDTGAIPNMQGVRS